MTPFSATLAPLVAHIRRMLMSAILVAAVLPLSAQTPVAQTATLPGHVLGILPKANHLARDPQRGNDEITIEVVLKPSDEQGLATFLKELEDSNSPNYHRPLEPSEVTARFGPTLEAYDKVLDYFEQNGFTLAVGSKNRRTITMRGTRAQAESAFHVQIDDYQLEERKFHAIAHDPSLPEEIAELVKGAAGLSNLGEWQAANWAGPDAQQIAAAYVGNQTAPPSGLNSLPPGIDGSGQTIGLIVMSDFNLSDISNFLSWDGLPSGLISNVSKVNINGGPGNSGNIESVLDVDSSLGTAPGAKIVAYEGPYNAQASDFYTLINGAIDDIGKGGTMSISYYMCENLIAQSDEQNLDSLLQTAAASGITLFAAAGDSGSSCRMPKSDGTFIYYPNTIPYPADAPHTVSVGGTSLHVHSNGSYKDESWWDDNGSGGFGTGQFTTVIDLISYTRSTPDVSLDADPLSGLVICQATAKVSPNCFPVGGTSMSSPMWAAYWSMVNQARSDGGLHPFSAGNGYLTTIPDVYHQPSSMTGTGNDATHLGMGTPKVPELVSVAGPSVRVTGVLPNFGSANGSTAVTILGQGFIGVKKVTFGGVDATNVQILNDSFMIVQSPAAPKAEVDVRVETPKGTSAETAADEFHYIPVLTKVSPDHGPLAGGAIVTVTGNALSAYHGFKYMFGGAAATAVSCSSTTTCTMTVPEHGLGKVELTIDTPFGNSPNSLAYTYAAPQITSFNPSIGPTTGGLYVSINGENLATGMTVQFGSTAVTGVVCGDETSCWVNNPSVSGPESVSLTATVNDVSSSATSAKFTFEVFPTVTNINPSSAAAGTTVTLTGTGFIVNAAAGQSIAQLGIKNPTNPTWFTFFGINVQGTCTSTTQCTAVVPANEAGPGITTAVTVTVDGNTSMDYVVFTNPGKPIVPTCKPGTCN
jgi:hypothetical protein